MAQQYRDMADLLRRDAVGLVWTLLPASLFFAGAFSSWFNYMLCRLILPALGHPLPPSTPFAEFRLPIWVIWAYALISLAVPLLAGGDMTALPWWGKLLLNVFTPLMFILVLAGLAVAYGWMRRRGWRRAWPCCAPLPSCPAPRAAGDAAAGAAGHVGHGV